MNAKSGYQLPRCVVLLAAVFGTRKAYDWAMDVLPAARSAENIDRDDTHDAESREEAAKEKRRFKDYMAGEAGSTEG